jgi:CRP/FNR family cyclic AMP-dependent transcriptional regulator
VTLAEIARVLGEDPDPREKRAERTAQAMNEKLWDEEHGIYLVLKDRVKGLLEEEKVRLLSVRLLSAVDVLEPLTPEQLEELSQRIPDVRVEQGRIFYAPGERSEALFLLKRGRVRIYKLAPDGREVTLFVAEAGTVFGELAHPGRRFHEAYAEVMEPAYICVMKWEELERLVREHPEVALRMMRVLSERLRFVANRLEDISVKEVPARLANLVLQLVESEGVMTPEGPRIDASYTHEQLATMIGASRARVTEALTRLKEAGALEVEHRHICVKDVEALKRAAEQGLRRER